MTAVALVAAAAVSVTPAYAAPGKGNNNGGGKGGGGNTTVTTPDPCTTLSDGTLNCPYLDDEPGEYTENYYSGQWGSAGGGGIIIGEPKGFWNAHVVYKLDPRATDTGEHDVVVEDARVADKNAYKIKTKSLVNTLNSVVDVNLLVSTTIHLFLRTRNF